MNLAIAISIAAEGFKNKTDKSGEPYILHCIRVMNNLHTTDKKLQSIAILHDCIEDGVISHRGLMDMCFFDRVVQAVFILTHDKHLSYEDYIKNLIQ